MSYWILMLLIAGQWITVQSWGQGDAKFVTKEVCEHAYEIAVEFYEKTGKMVDDHKCLEKTP